jgi:hypothetical protein
MISNGKILMNRFREGSETRPGIKHLFLFWPIYCYWLLIIATGMLFIFSDEMSSTYKQTKSYSEIFIYFIILYLIYFVIVRNWNKVLQFAINLFLIPVLVPILKNMAVFFLILDNFCNFEFRCAWELFIFFVAKEGFL